MNDCLPETFLTYKDSNFFVNNNIMDCRITNPVLHRTASLNKTPSFVYSLTTH